jgi:hypothetical protein
MRYGLRNFPLAIDPSVALIEVQLRMAHENELVNLNFNNQTPVSWRVLYRVPTQQVLAEGDAPPGAVHFFGDNQDFEKCHILVAYDTTGALTHLMFVSDDGHITVEEPPEEFLGQTVETPSVRLVFKDKVARERFINSLTPDLLSELVEPPRRIGVSVLKHA